jgi:hypothetical protein
VSTSLDAVDRLARFAAGAEPPALDDTGARRLIERALLEAPPTLRRAPTEHPARRSRWWPAVAVACACAALLAWLVPRPRPAPGEPELLQIALPTGDRLVGTGAQFDIEELAPATRRIRLRQGTMVFDVAAVVVGQRFEVRTDHVVVRARGTVFGVATDATRTRVHVLEGSVEVEHAGRIQVLSAGERWPDDAPAMEPAVVLAAARAAAAERAIARLETPGLPAPRGEPPDDPEVELTPSERDERDVGDTEPPAPRGETAALRTRTADARGESLDAARALLVERRYDEALGSARRATRRDPGQGAWHLVAADALRGLGRSREAAGAFETAARTLTGDDRAAAGFAAASLWFHELRDGNAALVALDLGAVDAEGSPLEERGLALRARVLESLGRASPARAIAERYLERFPHGGLRTYMRSLARSDLPPSTPP